LSDFKKAINADVPKSINIEIKQEEFELAESYQQNKTIELPGSASKKKREKKRNVLKKKELWKVRKEAQEDPQPKPSGILSK
jgi:hypothetical protein